MAARIRDREAIPAPSHPAVGQRVVALPTNIALKALVASGSQDVAGKKLADTLWPRVRG